MFKCCSAKRFDNNVGKYLHGKFLYYENSFTQTASNVTELPLSGNHQEHRESTYYIMSFKLCFPQPIHSV